MNFTNTQKEPVIIGIDHGYGNIKTAHCCFKAGVVRYDKEPTFKSNLLTYENKWRLIQEGAILEKVFPAVSAMELEKIEDYLCSISKHK